MSLPKKRNTRKKILLLIPVFLLVCLLIAYLFIIYRFEEVLKVVVNNESKGAYHFSSSRIDFAIWKNRIIIRNAVIEPRDTVQVKAHYSIRIKRIYLSLESFRDAILTHNMAVNDLAIEGLVVTGHSHTAEQAKKTVSLHASDVMDIISNISEKLQVKRFRLVDAAVNYSSVQSPEPFIADKINLSISNFRKKDSIQRDLLYTDDIDLSITNQSWKIPNGRQDICFNRLHYSARDQYIQLDTCAILVKGQQGSDSVSLYADKLRFTPRKLQEHLKNDELVIDSLVCSRPLLIVQKGNRKTKDSSGAIAGAMRAIFETVQLKYIDISQGSFQVFEHQASLPSYATELADIKIFNLQAPRGNFKGLNIDSIQWRLNNLVFLTRDSLYQLTVSEFSMKQNDLVFMNAVFGNAPGNPNPSNLNFSTPAIRLRNIDFEELLKKRLRAPSIEITKPVISLFAKAKRLNKNDTVGRFSTAEFYKVLHGLEELINVDSFRIVEGNLQLRSPGNTLAVDLKQINGIILINKFLKSDSLVDIKRAMPLMNIDNILVSTPDLQLTANRLRFKGNNRNNQLDAFRFNIKNSGTITGSKVAWDMFDWDIFQRSNTIRADKLSIEKMSASLQPGSTKKGAGLPKIKLRRLDIGSLDIDFKQPRSSLAVRLQAKKLYMDSIFTMGKLLHWNRLTSSINDFVLKTGSNELLVKKIELDNRGVSSLQNIRLMTADQWKKVSFNAPEIGIGLHILNTDFSIIRISSLVSAGSALNLEIYDEPTKKAIANTSPQPINLFIDKLDLQHSAFSYKNRVQKLEAGTILSLTGSGIHATGKRIENLIYKELGATATELVVTRPLMTVNMALLKLQLNLGSYRKQAGQSWSLQSALELGFEGSDINLGIISKRTADSSLLTGAGLRGNLVMDDFNITGNSFPDLMAIAKLATIKGSAVRYQNLNLLAGADSFAWKGLAGSFETGRFFYTPNAVVTSNASIPAWQKDELTVAGRRLMIGDLAYNHRSGDSGLHASRILVDGLLLETRRDKNLPFQHGREKLMPTVLFAALPVPVFIDTVQLQDGTVIVKEKSAQTKNTGVIPIENLNGYITNVTNRPGNNDLLKIRVAARVLNNAIEHFEYRERYTDSLSNFDLQFHASPMKLPGFSDATVPLANIKVMGGDADTIFAHWAGNKYAAIGRMNFYYRGLKIALLDKTDPVKKPLRIRLINAVINGVLRNRNKKETLVFYQRDREKFVFNYWVKTTLSGVVTSVGVKRNKRYFKQYNKLRGLYSLPPMPGKKLSDRIHTETTSIQLR